MASIPDNIASFCIDVAMVCMKNTYTHNNNNNIYMCDIWIKFVKESRGLSLGNLNCEVIHVIEEHENQHMPEKPKPPEGLAPWALRLRFSVFFV